MSNDDTHRTLNGKQAVYTGQPQKRWIEPLVLTPSLLDQGLKGILETRFREAQLCLDHSPFATIMLCGSLLEGILLGVAQKRPKDFNSSPQSPKQKDRTPKHFNEWSLAEFINVAHGLGLLSPDVQKFSHCLRDFRNYIHPYQQMKENFDPNRNTAEMCLLTVKLAIECLNLATEPAPQKISSDWTQHPDATYVALAVLLGSWQEKNKCDLEVVSQFLEISYDEWLKKAREILHCPGSPLSVTNGEWSVADRAELWGQLGSRLLDQNLNSFKSLAISVLKEPDPAFELFAEERFAAIIYNKELRYSCALRKGIAEGLAILGSLPKACCHCSLGKAGYIANIVIRELLSNADWVLWGSLNNLLPALAESAPSQFLEAVENAIRQTPCAFDELFSQEGTGIGGGNYLTGLLWALEGLAWDKQLLVRACVALGELASHDPGGKSSNRPANSLVTILLPWLPQTLASADKRYVAVNTILKEMPDVGWDLLLRLLPRQHPTSFGSYKPSWRRLIPAEWENTVTLKEYSQQASLYAELAVTAAGHNTARLTALIDLSDNLPKTTLYHFLEVLGSESISDLPEEQKLSIWNHLTKNTNKHRRFSDAKWALTEEQISRIEQIAQKLAPTKPFYLYQHLFSEHDVDLYEKNGDYTEQQKLLETKRRTAISEILQQDGPEGVIRFAESVSFPIHVGYALGVIADPVIEQKLLPRFLNDPNDSHRALAQGYTVWRFCLRSWEWCDGIDKTDWTPEQLGQFLAYLSFKKEAWDRVSVWLAAHENEYWTRTSVNAYDKDNDLPVAVDKLIEYGRPLAAINCLSTMCHFKQPINADLCIKALNAALFTSEPSSYIDRYHIVELIKLLQSEPSVNQDELLKVEFAYVRLLDHHSGASPLCLERKLASSPEFFCEVIQLIYQSNKKNQPPKQITEESRAIAQNARQLLYEWRTAPGLQADGKFCGDNFANWLSNVKAICTESGHLPVAFNHVGEVLIHVPPDPDGLWIHRSVATALNDRENDDIRTGYGIGVCNSRGFHEVDPTGKPERDLAAENRKKAEIVENAGYQRFAVALREIAQNYDRDAERIIADYQSENQ